MMINYNSSYVIKTCLLFYPDKKKPKQKEINKFYKLQYF